jgi:hypothetical protein
MSGEYEAESALARSASRQVGDIGLRFRTLLRRLGGGLDGPGGFGDADAWYCILEGTAEISVAEAQARALADLLASYATSGGQTSREILLAMDEFTAPNVQQVGNSSDLRCLLHCLDVKVHRGYPL